MSVNFFRNPITKWLAVAFSLFLAIILIQGLFALRQMNTIREQTEEISNNWLPSAALIGNLNTDTSDFRVAQLRHNLATASQQEELADQKAEMQTELAAIAKNEASYVPLITSAEERRLYESYETKWSQYLEVHEKFLPLSQANKDQEATELLRGSTALFKDLSDDLDKLVALNRQGAIAADEKGEAAYSRSVQIVSGLILLALVMGSVAALMFSKLIFRSVAGVLWPAINQLLSSVGVLASSSQQASAASMQNAGVAQQVAAGAAQQSRQSEEVSHTITQMAAATAQMSASAQAASSVSLRTSQIAEDTGRKTEKIEKAVDTITNIAEQTNLLSLNASIEAARAGEQGRGFAVVADEVKKLAEQSATSATEVKTIVKDVVDSISSTVSSIQNVSAKVEEVSAAAQEQAAAIHQIAKTMDSVAAVTEQNAAGATSLSSAAEQQSAAIQQIAGVSDKLQTIADTLSGLAGNGHHNQEIPVQPSINTHPGHHPPVHHPIIKPDVRHQEFEKQLERVQDHLQPKSHPSTLVQSLQHDKPTAPAEQPNRPAASGTIHNEN